MDFPVKEIIVAQPNFSFISLYQDNIDTDKKIGEGKNSISCLIRFEEVPTVTSSFLLMKLAFYLIRD